MMAAPTFEQCLLEAHEEYARAWLAANPLPINTLEVSA